MEGDGMEETKKKKKKQGKILMTQPVRVKKIKKNCAK